MTEIGNILRLKGGERGRVGTLPLVEIVLLAVFLALPAFLDHFWTIFATRVLILSLLGLSFDLVWGYTGILSFGQALFFGAAGFVAALFARDLDISSFFVVIPAAVLTGFVLATLMGAFLMLGRTPPSIIFVALGTLTGSYAAERLARGWYYLGGQNGISVVSPLTFGETVMYEGVGFYYFVLGAAVLIYGGCRLLVRSQFGLVLAGIRQQEDRITFFGYKVRFFKVAIFSLSGAIAGFAGGLYAFHEGFVWPSLMGVILSTQVVLYVLFGGAGTLIGAVIGVSAIEYAGFFLADRYPEVWPIVLGALLLAVIVFRPTGVISFLVSERERVGSFAARGGKTHGRRAGRDGAA